MRDGMYVFGIIGCGMIANFHADAVKALENAYLKGVADIKSEYTQDFSMKHRVQGYNSIQSLLSDREIDIICICSPSGLHAEHAIMAANAGKHVVVEKPMTLTLEDADRVIAVCEQNKVKMEIISQLRFSDAIKKVKTAVDEGKLGRIVSGDIYMKYFRSQEYYNNSIWKGTWKMDGGGALMNQGIHGVDLIRYIMGPVKSLFAFTRTLSRNIETEDTASAVLEYKNGALGVIQATTSVYPGYARRIEICGDKGSIVLEEDIIVKWDIEGEYTEINNVGMGIAAGASSNPSSISSNGHVMQLKDIIRAIEDDTDTLVSGKEGRKPLEVILSIYESSKTNKPIVFE